MDSSWLALQTNGKLFRIRFQIIGREPKNIHRITRLGYASEVGEAFVLISTRSSILFPIGRWCCPSWGCSSTPGMNSPLPSTAVCRAQSFPKLLFWKSKRRPRKRTCLCTRWVMPLASLVHVTNVHLYYYDVGYFFRCCIKYLVSQLEMCYISKIS